MKMTDGIKRGKPENSNNIILRNALIEGTWAFTTYMVGAGVAGLRGDVLAWFYGAIASFLTGAVGYLVKSYKLGEKKKS